MHARFNYRNFSFDVTALQNLSNKQDRQCTYNVTSNRVRVTTVRGNAIRIITSVCILMLSHPACNAHAPHYTDICGLSGCTILFHIISRKSRFSGGGGWVIIEHKKRVLSFSANVFRNISHSNKKLASYYH